ncbi:MAG: tetratricopeptide repeat protein [Alphaproteobacteria bacterium]
MAAVVAALYFPSLFGGLIHDDWAMIAGNEERMRGLAALRRFFSAGVWESSNLESRDTALYRPVWLVWNFALYNLFGEDPFYWRAASLALHIFNTLLVAALLGVLIPAMTRMEQAIGALIFACHPVKPQSVAWISGSTDLLLTSFFVAAVLLFVRYRRTGNPWALGATVLCYCGAVLTKEPGIVLPAVLLAADLWLVEAPRAGGRRRSWLGTYSLLGAVALGYLVLRGAVLGGALRGGQDSLVLSGETLSRMLEYWLSYLHLLLVPWPVPYHFRYVAEGVAGQVTYAVGALVFMTLIFALWRGRAARVAVLWLGVTLAVPLVLALHKHGVFAPRFLYLPSVGAILLLASGYLWLKARQRFVAAALFSVTLVVLAGLTMLDLPNWRDELTWTARSLQSDPASSDGWAIRAKHYERLGEAERVAETYRRAIRAVAAIADRAVFIERLALHEAERGRYDASLAIYRQLSTLAGFEAAGFIGMGNVYWVTGLNAEALETYDRALAHDPANALALYNRARLSEAAGDTQAALAHYRRLLELPETPAFRAVRSHALAFVQRWGG